MIRASVVFSVKKKIGII